MAHSETSASFPVVEEAFPVAPDRTRLYRCVHVPESVRGVVLLTHGLGDHSSRYGHVIHALTAANIAVVRYDLRGHGRSDGPRGHAPHYETLLDDQSLMFEWTRQQFRDLPILAHGYSLGGNLVANWIMKRPRESSQIIGTVLSSPWFLLATRPSPLKVAIIKSLGVVWPNFAIPAGVRPKRLMRSEDVIDSYEHDKLIHRRVSARLVSQAFDAGQWALDHAAEFPVPSLCLHGGADTITCPAATLKFSSLAPNSTMRLFPDLVHEPHNEPEWREVVAYTRDWALDRIAAATMQLPRIDPQPLAETR